MLGTYRDRVYDRNRGSIFDSGWCANTIVDSAWLLVAGLLKNDPTLQGILFWAVGAGLSAWDASRPAADPSTARLVNEIDRQAISEEDIAYLDPNGNPVNGPTNRIESFLSFTWPDTPQTLREFGLYGGNATDEKDSGYLLNYVTHPRVDLDAGATLTRTMRFSLQPEVGTAWLVLPQHWLGEEAVKLLDGVGTKYADALAAAGLETIRELADAEPTALEETLPLMKAVELRAKARLTLRAAEQMSPVSGLVQRTVWDVLATPLATMAAETGASEEAIGRLREQLGALQLTLDNRFLRKLTVGELAQPL